MGLENVDIKYINVVVEWLKHHNNSDFDFQSPYLRTALRHLYPLYIFLYSALFLFATVGNIGILATIICRRLYKNPMYVFIGNLALSDLFKAVIVLPLTLANLLIQNWIFGSLLCYLLPMMHYFPVHASILTLLMTAVDRYRLIVHPIKSRLPAGLCAIGVWVVSVCAVLPYAVYIEYIDLGKWLGHRFEGVGMCLLNIEHNAQQYIRAIFVVGYCLPLGVIASLFIKVSTEIKYSLSDSVPIRIDYSRSTTPEGVSYSRVTWLSRDSDATVTDQSGIVSSTPAYRSRRYGYHDDDDDDDDINVAKETRIQNHLISMVVLFAVCWLPINILNIVSHFVYETSENSGHYDITYTTLTLVGFLSTCVNPILFVSLRLQPETKERIRGYFQFSPANSTIMENTASIVNSPSTQDGKAINTSPKPPKRGESDTDGSACASNISPDPNHLGVFSNISPDPNHLGVFSKRC